MVTNEDHALVKLFKKQKPASFSLQVFYCCFVEIIIL